MAKVDWIDGKLNPPTSGDYYVIEELMLDIPTEQLFEGDIEVTTDYYDAEQREWEELGKDNPYWKVVAWAYILRPDVPDCVKDKVVRYFGNEVENG